MSGRVHRDFRKQANEAGKMAARVVVEDLGPALRGIATGAAATHKQVEVLDSRVKAIEHEVSEWDALLNGGFWVRFRWLLVGK